jgi:hypothetical protein
LVTVTLLAAAAAVEATVTVAVSWVELTKVVELTVMPVPENEAVAPLTKPVPLIVMLWLLAPCPSELGLVEETVGAGLTVKPPLLVAVLPSPLVIDTSRGPVAADADTVTFALSWVALVKVIELTVIPDPNEAASEPLMKPVPVIVMAWLLAPCPRELGLNEEIVGAALTVNALALAMLPSPLVTVTVRRPMVAVEEIVMFAVTEVALTNVVELTVTPAPPNDAASAGPLSKFVPLIVTL